MIKKYIKSNTGFSLLEVMVAVLIFTIATSGFALIFTSAINHNKITINRANNIRESTSNIDNALANFTNEGIIPNDMILDDNAEINITIDGNVINLNGYIVEGSGDAGNKAFFPKIAN